MPKVGGNDFGRKRVTRVYSSFICSTGLYQVFFLFWGDFHHLGLAGRKGKELKCVHSLRPLKKCMNWGCFVDKFLKNHFRFTVSMAPVLPFCQGASCEALWYLQAGGQCWGSPEMPILLRKRAGDNILPEVGLAIQFGWFFKPSTLILHLLTCSSSASNLCAHDSFFATNSSDFLHTFSWLPLAKAPISHQFNSWKHPKNPSLRCFFYTKLRCVLISMVPGPFFMSWPQPQSPFPDPVIAFHKSPNSYRWQSLRCSFRKWQPGGFAGRVKWTLLHFGWWWFWYTVYIHIYIYISIYIYLCTYTYAWYMNIIWIYIFFFILGNVMHFADFWQNSWILP